MGQIKVKRTWEESKDYVLSNLPFTVIPAVILWKPIIKMIWQKPDLQWNLFRTISLPPQRSPSWPAFSETAPTRKLVRVINGTVFDVVVDLRSHSGTYGKWFGEILSAENNKQFYIPEGFAHGFLVLSDTAEFCYKCTDFYHPGDEGGLAWNDPEIGIEWPELVGEYSRLRYCKRISFKRRDISYLK